MKYRTKVIINGAELTDEQKENASSITSVTVTRSCGSGFQIGSTASSMLEFTVIKPYKESFDGDKVDFYIKEEESDEVSKELQLAEEVGDTTATEHVEELTDESELETEETEDPDVEEGDVTEEEEAEEEAEENAQAEALFEMMNGEDATEEEEEPEPASEAPGQWTLLGSFYVYKQTNNNDGTVTLQCFDGFQLMNDPYTPSIQQGTFQQFYDDIRTQCQEKGIIVDADTFEEEMNPELEWNQECTLREAIGYLAGLQGGFATFGDDNTLGISFYSYEDSVILRSNLLSSTGTSAGETTVEGIVCTVNLRQDTIEAGDGGGQSLYFYNPFMTQEILDGILEEYQGMRYTGGLFRMSWNPELMPGDLTRVMSDNEYKNYLAMQNALQNSGSMSAAEILNLKKEINAVGTPVLVSTETVTFGGEAVAEIRSHLMTETEKANAPLSPSDAKFRVVTADLIKTKELVAEKADITDLNATNAAIETLKAEKADITDLNAAKATIEDLKAADVTITGQITAATADIDSLRADNAAISGRVTAAEADINSVKADYVKASELDAKAATIVQAEIGKATIKDAQIESINGNKIIDGSIVAAALSQEVVKNFRNNNIYYQADAPEGEDLKEGDLWYKTLTKTSGDRAGVLFVYDGSGWVNKPFDSESILAKSITAAEIATGTITSSQLAAHTITANEIEAGTITAKEMNMENLQTNIARVGDSEGKHLDILTDGIEIKDGTKQLAKYGDSVVIGEEARKHLNIDNSGLEVSNGNTEMFRVKAFAENEKFRDVWTSDSSYSGIGKSFSPQEIYRQVVYRGQKWADTYPLTFEPAGPPTRVAFVFSSGIEVELTTKETSGAYYTTDDQDITGRIIKVVIDGSNDNLEALEWDKAVQIYIEYRIAFNPSSVRIGEGATEDEIIEEDGRTIYDYKAIKVGKGKRREGNFYGDNAFEVDYQGNTYVGGNLKVNEDIQLQGGKSIHDFITDLIYPVGSIYISVNAADPSTLFGGTWERIKDTFLLSAGDTYSAGASGGSPDAIVVSHTHTQASHTHYTLKGEGWGYPVYNVNKSGITRTRVKTDSSGRYTYLGTSGASSADASNIDWGGQLGTATPSINSTGSSGAGKNMPPYLAVYVWKRIS